MSSLDKFLSGLLAASIVTASSLAGAVGGLPIASAEARAKKDKDSLKENLKESFKDAQAVVPSPGADKLNLPVKEGRKERPAQRLKFTGAVIRYDRVSIDMTKEQWLQVLENLNSLGIETIIIHNHHYLPRLSPTGETVEELNFLPVPMAGLTSGATVAKNVVSKTAEAKTTKVTSTKAASAVVASAKGTSTKVTSAKAISTKGKLSRNVVRTPATRSARVIERIDRSDRSEAAAKPPVLVNAKVDASGIILDYADAHKMKVYMGLWMDQNWYPNLDVMDQLAHTLNRSKFDLEQLKQEMTDKKGDTTRTAAEIKDAESEIAVCERGLITVQNELEENSLYFAANKDGQLAGPCMRLADSIEKLYGSHPSFAGWYLPEEIWDAAFSEETIAVLNPLIKLLSTYCQSISPSDRERPFAMTPKASRLHYDSEEEIYRSHLELLKGTGVDVLMLEDSVGDLNLKEDDDISVRVKKHFTAFSRVAADLKIPLWACLETFEQQGTVRKPTNISRLKKQFQYTSVYLDKKNQQFFAYDYLRYLSLPVTKYPNPEMRGKLFDEYKRDFIDSPFIPQQNQ